MRTTRMWSCDSGGDPVCKPRTRALEPDDQEHLLRALWKSSMGRPIPTSSECGLLTRILVHWRRRRKIGASTGVPE
jgi:hypothetical protein